MSYCIFSCRNPTHRGSMYSSQLRDYLNQLHLLSDCFLIPHVYLLMHFLLRIYSPCVSFTSICLTLYPLSVTSYQYNFKYFICNTWFFRIISFLLHSQSTLLFFCQKQHNIFQLFCQQDIDLIIARSVFNVQFGQGLPFGIKVSLSSL